MLATTASYAACNTSPNDKELINMLILSKAEQFDSLNKYFNEYCYYPDRFKEKNLEIPTYFANSVKSFKIFESRDTDVYQRKNRFGLDMLGYALISDFLIRPLVQDEKEVFDKTVAELKINPVPFTGITPKNREELINYVAPKYVGQTYFKRDIFDLNPVYYSVITNNPKVLKLLAPSSTALVTTNKSQVSPVHYFFAPHYKDSTTVNDNDMREINDYLLTKINTQTIDRLAFYGPKTITFFELAEVMKEYNMDLYNKLKTSKNFRVRPQILNPNYQEVLKKDILMILDFKNTISREKEHLT